MQYQPDFMLKSDENETTYLEASEEEGKISVGITEWAETFSITLTKEQARQLGDWLLKVT